jgi:hypothetical protein
MRRISGKRKRAAGLLGSAAFFGAKKYRSDVHTVFAYSHIENDFHVNVKVPTMFLSEKPYSSNNPIDIEIFMPDNRISSLKGIVRRTTRTPIPSMKNGMGIEITEKDCIFIDFEKSIIGEK